MSQDPDTPSNVKVQERSDIKNAYEVSFFQYGKQYRIIFKCMKDNGIWKVDNVIYPATSNEPLFNYTGKFETCYSLDCYSLPSLLHNFVWSVTINGEKQLIQFRCYEGGDVDGTGYIQRSSANQNVRIYKGSISHDNDGNATIQLKEYVQGLYIRKHSIHFNDSYEYIVMESNGKSYKMTLVEPVIR